MRNRGLTQILLCSNLVLKYSEGKKDTASFRKECQLFAFAESQPIKQDDMKSLCKIRSDRHMSRVIIINMNFKNAEARSQSGALQAVPPPLPPLGAERAGEASS